MQVLCLLKADTRACILGRQMAAIISRCRNDSALSNLNEYRCSPKAIANTLVQHLMLYVSLSEVRRLERKQHDHMSISREAGDRSPANTLSHYSE